MFSVLSSFVTSPLHKKINVALERAKLYVTVGNKIDIAEIKEINQYKEGFACAIKLPIGIHQEHVEKSVATLSSAFDAELEYYIVGRMFYVMFYTNHIPDELNFSDQFLTKGEVAPVWNVGISRRGMITVNFAELASPMMMFASSTGYGKTSTIKTALTQFIWQGHEVGIGDPKLDYNAFKGFANHQTEPEDIKEMIQMYANRALERQKEITDKGYENIIEHNHKEKEKLSFIFVLVDEILDFPTDEDDFWEPVSHIVRKGRSAGVYFGASLQRVSADMFPKVIRNNIALRLCLRMEDDSDSKLVLGNEAASKLPPTPGRAIMRQDQQIELQVPKITKEQVSAILNGIKKEDR